MQGVDQRTSSTATGAQSAFWEGLESLTKTVEKKAAEVQKIAAEEGWEAVQQRAAAKLQKKAAEVQKQWGWFTTQSSQQAEAPPEHETSEAEAVFNAAQTSPPKHDSACRRGGDPHFSALPAGPAVPLGGGTPPPFSLTIHPPPLSPPPPL